MTRRPPNTILAALFQLTEDLNDNSASLFRLTEAPNAIPVALFRLTEHPNHNSAAPNPFVKALSTSPTYPLFLSQA